MECANCHASKARIDAWLQRAEGQYRAAGLGAPMSDFVCCEGPYEIVPPATCSKDLMFRSLPGGEDR
jgi:hypothetical protein